MEKAAILIVEDDPIVRTALTDILSYSNQYCTENAATGEEGIEKVKTTDYDLVFTDLTMPGMNGIDFMRRALRIKPGLPFVVITGYPTLENAVNAMKEGAKDFITKPFSVATVLSVADRVIGEQSLFRRIATGVKDDVSASRLNSTLFRKLQEISILQAVSTELDGLQDNREIYDRILEMASRLLTVQEASFGIVENGQFKIKRAINTVEKEIAPAGNCLEHVIRKGQYVLCQPGDINPHTGKPLASPLLSIPLTINNEVFGVINLSQKINGSTFSEEDISLALAFAKKVAQRIENNALYEVFYNNLINTLKSLVMSIGARDSYTKQHSERVTAYALQIADIMEVSDREKDALKFGGYLHDIGKIGVRDTVLLKPDKLTAEEIAEIQQHPMIGDAIIKPIRFLPKEREIILHHHERYDGKGYPHGLSGNQIPLGARILAVADTFDAMTTSRPYRKALTTLQAVDEIRRCSQTQFDGQVVRAFLQLLAKKGELYDA